MGKFDPLLPFRFCAIVQALCYGLDQMFAGLKTATAAGTPEIIEAGGFRLLAGSPTVCWNQ
jgi:hypothetical protein